MYVYVYVYVLQLCIMNFNANYFYILGDTLKKINGVNVTWNNIDKILATISSPQNVS